MKKYFISFYFILFHFILFYFSPPYVQYIQVGSRRGHDLTETESILPQLGSGPDSSPGSLGSGFYTVEDYKEILRVSEGQGGRCFFSSLYFFVRFFLSFFLCLFVSFFLSFFLFFVFSFCFSFSHSFFLFFLSFFILSFFPFVFFSFLSLFLSFFISFFLSQQSCLGTEKFHVFVTLMCQPFNEFF